MDDGVELAGYVEVWWQAVTDFTALLEELPDAAWSTPTDLPGWDVRACAAHVVHLESVLAGGVEPPAEVGEPSHVTGPMGLFTEIGVVNRRGRAPASIVAELREVTTRRHHALVAEPPTDADTQPDVGLPGVPWPWRTLLRNRPLDVWMHEQDVRRAVNRPDHLGSAPARHTAGYLAEGLGSVLAKRAGAAVGSTLVLELEGLGTYAFEVSGTGRGQRLATPPDRPTVTLGMNIDSFTRLAGGRRAPEPGVVTVAGDTELGQRVQRLMATIP